jgi:hypothetical protein
VKQLFWKCNFGNTIILKTPGKKWFEKMKNRKQNQNGK